MSHWLGVKVEVKDLIAVSEAARELGCTFTAKGEHEKYCNDTEGRQWYCDAIIQVPGVYYPVQLKKDASGVYRMTYESDLARDLAKRLGEGCKKLTQLYNVHVMQKAAVKVGLSVRRVMGTNGKINLVCQSV